MSDAVYRVEHETRYVHAGGVSMSQHLAYLTPRTLPGQLVRSHEIEIEPAPASRTHRLDYFGNAVTHFAILTPYDELCVVGRSVVALSAIEPDIAHAGGAPGEWVRDELAHPRDMTPYASKRRNWATRHSYVEVCRGAGRRSHASRLGRTVRCWPPLSI